MRLLQTLARWRSRWFPPLSLGTKGERAAAAFLKRQRLKILHRGYRILGGEIDIVAVDGRTLVFIEVKTRQSHDAGHPAEAVDPTKQRQLSQLALAYLKRYRLLDHPARFDVVAVTWPAGDNKPRIDHIRHAFESTT